MAIRVRLFASLQERWRIDQMELEAEGLATVADVWRALTGEDLAEGILAAVNMEYARPETPVQDGDEVAFFPPVTGG